MNEEIRNSINYLDKLIDNSVNANNIILKCPLFKLNNYNINRVIY